MAASTRRLRHWWWMPEPTFWSPGRQFLVSAKESSQPWSVFEQLRMRASERKFETRNPKLETNSNDQKNKKTPNQLIPDFDFWISDLTVSFVSVRGASFELRISDFDS